MPADNKSLPERNDVLQQVIADYLTAEASGRPMERSQLLARHPEFADELQAFFADHDQVIGDNYFRAQRQLHDRRKSSASRRGFSLRLPRPEAARSPYLLGREEELGRSDR